MIRELLNQGLFTTNEIVEQTDNEGRLTFKVKFEYHLPHEGRAFLSDLAKDFAIKDRLKILEMAILSDIEEDKVEQFVSFEENAQIFIDRDLETMKERGVDFYINEFAFAYIRRCKVPNLRPLLKSLLRDSEDTNIKHILVNLFYDMQTELVHADKGLFVKQALLNAYTLCSEPRVVSLEYVEAIKHKIEEERTAKRILAEQTPTFEAWVKKVTGHNNHTDKNLEYLRTYFRTSIIKEGWNNINLSETTIKRHRKQAKKLFLSHEP